jgi:hypothetical protein
MKRVLLASSVLGPFVLGGCPGPDKNPAVLWLAPNGSEVVIQLVDKQPAPW